jgi:hypothetical protein
VARFCFSLARSSDLLKTHVPQKKTC